MQTITSAETSLNQIPALHKSSLLDMYVGAAKAERANGGNFAFIIDYGGDYGGEIFLMNRHNIPVFSYDPYNRPAQENKFTAEVMEAGYCPIVICANVLNIINDDDAIREILSNIRRAMRNVNGVALFTVYEGNKSGIAAATKAGYQRNARTSEYIPILQESFHSVEKRGKILIARNAF